MTSAPRPSVSRRTSSTKSTERVVDAVVEPQLGQPVEPLGALDAVASTVAPARLASWMAAMPTPLAPAWTSAVSPAWRRPNSNRQSSAVPNGTGTQAASSVVTPSGMIQQNGLAHHPQLGVGAVQAHGDDPVARRRFVDPVARRHHGTGALVADDVGNLGHGPAQPVEGVASLDADRLDPDQHLASGRQVGSGTSS